MIPDVHKEGRVADDVTLRLVLSVKGSYLKHQLHLFGVLEKVKRSF